MSRHLVRAKYDVLDVHSKHIELKEAGLSQRLRARDSRTNRNHSAKRPAADWLEREGARGTHVVTSADERLRNFAVAARDHCSCSCTTHFPLGHHLPFIPQAFEPVERHPRCRLRRRKRSKTRSHVSPSSMRIAASPSDVLKNAKRCGQPFVMHRSLDSSDLPWISVMPSRQDG